jgi:hypothetical protein
LQGDLQMFNKLKEFLFGKAEVATPAAPYKVETPAPAKVSEAVASQVVAATPKKSAPKKSAPKKSAPKKSAATNKPRARKAAKPGHN